MYFWFPVSWRRKLKWCFCSVLFSDEVVSVWFAVCPPDYCLDHGSCRVERYGPVCVWVKLHLDAHEHAFIHTTQSRSQTCSNKVSLFSLAPPPTPTLYLSLWDLKHGNPISAVSFLGKDTLHEACGNLLIPDSLTMVALPSFIHPRFLGISEGFSLSIFKHSHCYQRSKTREHKKNLLHQINLVRGWRMAREKHLWDRHCHRSVGGFSAGSWISLSASATWMSLRYYSKSKNAIIRPVTSSCTSAFSEKFIFLYSHVGRFNTTSQRVWIVYQA